MRRNIPDNISPGFSPEGRTTTQNQTIINSPPNQSVGVSSNAPLNQTFNLQTQPVAKSPFAQNAFPNASAPQVPPPPGLDITINRYISGITGLVFFTLLWNLVYLEAFCLFRFACIPDGVETPMYVIRSMGAIFFLVLLFIIGIYYVSKSADKAGVRFFKFFNTTLIITLLVLFIISFFRQGQFSASDISHKWSQLTSQERYKYNDNINNLVKINQDNLLFHGIYLVVLFVLFVTITIVLYNFDFVLPQRWLNASKMRTSFQEDSLIIIPLVKPRDERRVKKAQNLLARNKFAMPVIGEQKDPALLEREVNQNMANFFGGNSPDRRGNLERGGGAFGDQGHRAKFDDRVDDPDFRGDRRFNRDDPDDIRPRRGFDDRNDPDDIRPPPGFDRNDDRGGFKSPDRENPFDRRNRSPNLFDDRADGPNRFDERAGGPNRFDDRRGIEMMETTNSVVGPLGRKPRRKNFDE